MASQTRLAQRRQDERRAALSMDQALEEAGALEYEEQKFGAGEYHFATGPNRLHVTGPNQAITGDREGMKIAPGETMTFRISKPNNFSLELPQGMYSLHPQVGMRPSTDAFPLQVFIPQVPRDMVQIAKLTKAITEILELLA